MNFDGALYVHQYAFHVNLFRSRERTTHTTISRKRNGRPGSRRSASASEMCRYYCIACKHLHVSVRLELPSYRLHWLWRRFINWITVAANFTTGKRCVRISGIAEFHLILTFSMCLSPASWWGWGRSGAGHCRTAGSCKPKIHPWGKVIVLVSKALTFTYLYSTAFTENISDGESAPHMEAEGPVPSPRSDFSQGTYVGMLEFHRKNTLQFLYVQQAYNSVTFSKRVVQAIGMMAKTDAEVCPFFYLVLTTGSHNTMRPPFVLYSECWWCASSCNPLTVRSPLDN